MHILHLSDKLLLHILGYLALPPAEILGCRAHDQLISETRDIVDSYDAPMGLAKLPPCRRLRDAAHKVLNKSQTVW